MTATLDRPPASSADDGDWLPLPVSGSSPTRLAARLAWREVVRRRLRTALVVVLIAVPTAAMVLAAATYRTNLASNDLRYARAGADVVSSGSDAPADIAALGLPDTAHAVSYLFTQVAIVPSSPPADTTITFDDGSLWVTLSDMPIDDPRWAGMVAFVDGRAPGDGEVLLGPSVARAMGVGVGDRVTLTRPSGTWTVSGIARFAPDHWTELMVVSEFDAERVVPDMRRFETLVDIDGATPDELNRIAGELDGYVVGSDLDAAADADPAGLTLGWLIGAMTFLAFGIVIAAAFATSARNQLLSVGQLAANGAPQRLIVRVLSWQGLWSGLLGGIVGVGLAVALMPLLHDAAQREFFHASVGWVVRPLDVVVIVVTAAVAGLFAALVPSRSLARTSVLAALAGRRPIGAVPRRMLPVGAALLAGGTGLVTLAMLASRDQTDTAPFLAAAVVGGGAIAVGTCCVSPWIIDQFGRIAGALPLAGRLALRGMSRSRGRSAAVVSAIAVTVAIATAAVGGIERELHMQLDGDRYLPRDTIVIDQWTDRLAAALGTPNWPEPLPAQVDLPPVADAVLPAGVSADLESRFPGAVTAEVRRAVTPAGTVATQTAIDNGDFDLQATIADPATLRAGGWSDAAAALLDDVGYATLATPGDPGSRAITVRNEPSATAGGSLALTPAVIEDPSAPTVSAFSVLMTERFAREHGLDVVTTGTIVRTPEPLSAAERDYVSGLWATLNPSGVALSSFVEPTDSLTATAGDDDFTNWDVNYQWVDSTAERGMWVARGIALAAAIVLIGVVVAIGLALAAADNRAERDVLAVAGARPAALRRMAAWNAVTTTAVGILIGVPVGFIPAWVVVRAVSVTDVGVAFPWLFVGALFAVVPAVMLGAAWTGSALGARFGRSPSPRRAD